MNRDALIQTSPEAVIHAALGAIDRASDLQPHVQGPALAMALIAYAKRLSLDVGDLFTVANNILHSKADDTPAFEAMRLYMKHEVTI